MNIIGVLVAQSVYDADSGENKLFKTISIFAPRFKID